MAFLLVWDKIGTQGVSLCCFHAYMYYNPNWFITRLARIYHQCPAFFLYFLDLSPFSGSLSWPICDLISV
jgi:hypothetical protein